MNRNAISVASLAASLAVHAWLLLASADGKAPQRPAIPPAFVEFTVVPPDAARAPEPPLEPPVAAPKPAAKKPIATPAKARSAVTEVPPQALEAPTEEPPQELSGTTLASELGDGWTAPRGSGGSRPLVARVASLSSSAAHPVVAKNGANETARRREPPEAIPLAHLSRKPAPPPLAAALEQNYPPEARKMGQGGDASVRARIEANGSVHLAKVASESARSFGEACRRTLLASKWSAPRDLSGKPVATWITYRCRFRIDD